MIKRQNRWYWATAMLCATVVIAPSAQAEVLTASLDPVQLELDYTSDRTPIAAGVGYALGRRDDHLPTYIPRADRIILKLGERRVYVYDGDRAIDSYPVAIGAPGTPTPTGQFEIFQMIENPSWQSPWTGEVFAPGANSALGLRWIGFTEMSNGIIGFHGTPTVSSIGRAASNGCVRLRNEDVLALYSHVRMGMMVVVEP
ncbi:L,D-transpeptidase [Halomicronema sp. CCY15110]|uniref:L,D-transpeptidase n=1 Tax=Halomicronema sp. CCY15110 TaxID=2767773 RepID=UPI001EF18CD5|nr:L,D-transpeptidase [Halomicronema sp. CCY15110]